jgi:hypothetical protein
MRLTPAGFVYDRKATAPTSGPFNCRAGTSSRYMRPDTEREAGMAEDSVPGVASLNPAELHRPSTMGHLKRRTYLRGFLLGRSFYRAAEAMDFAAHLHTGVRTLLPHLRHPEETLEVGFLHDVVEDCGVPVTEIEARFGTLIAEATDAMSKEVDGVKRSSESVVQMQANSPIASIVKRADRINNQQTMPGVFTQDKILQYLAETRSQIIPMLKQARGRYPDQELAYENAKTVL